MFRTAPDPKGKRRGEKSNSESDVPRAFDVSSNSRFFSFVVVVKFHGQSVSMMTIETSFDAVGDTHHVCRSTNFRCLQCQARFYCDLVLQYFKINL